MNFRVGLAMCLIYVVTNIIIFFPSLKRAKNALMELGESGGNYASNPLHGEGEQNARQTFHLDPSHEYLKMSELAPGAVSSKPPGSHRKRADRKKAHDKKHDSCPTESRSVAT